MIVGMYKKAVLSLLAAAASVSLMAAGPDDRDVSPVNEEIEIVYDISYHDVSLSYGLLSINDITGIMDQLVPSLVGFHIADRTWTGSINLGYGYRLTPHMTVGGMLGYSGNMGRLDGRSGYVYKNFYSIMPQVKYEWYEKGSVTLYSRLAIGVLIADLQSRSGIVLEGEQSAATVTFQVSPIGIELGRTVAGFAEAGFGATGVLALGVRARF